MKNAHSHGVHIQIQKDAHPKRVPIGLCAYSDRKVFILGTDSIRLAVLCPLVSLQCPICSQLVTPEI